MNALLFHQNQKIKFEQNSVKFISLVQTYILGLDSLHMQHIYLTFQMCMTYPYPFLHFFMSHKMLFYGALRIFALQQLFISHSLIIFLFFIWRIPLQPKLRKCIHLYFLLQRDNGAPTLFLDVNMSLLHLYFGGERFHS